MLSFIDEFIYPMYCTTQAEPPRIHFTELYLLYTALKDSAFISATM